MGFINIEHTIWYRKYVLELLSIDAKPSFLPHPPEIQQRPVQPSSTSMTTGKKNILIYQHVNNPSWNSFVFLLKILRSQLESPLALESHSFQNGGEIIPSLPGSTWIHLVAAQGASQI